MVMVNNSPIFITYFPLGRLGEEGFHETIRKFLQPFLLLLHLELSEIGTENVKHHRARSIGLQSERIAMALRLGIACMA